LKALVVFHDEGERHHVLSPLLKKGFWHCFVVVERNGLWLLVDGRDGTPDVKYICNYDDDFDLAAFYRDKGMTVIETAQRQGGSPWPLCLRNCVGLVKTLLCLRSWALTPYQLYKHIERTQR
jgi:hypothetical protein